MHELSLVQALMEQLTKLAKEHKASEIHRVSMEIGPLAGVVIDSFEFAFGVLAKEQPLTSKAQLEITTPVVSYRCLDCQQIVEGCRERPASCPACQAPMYPEGGDELILSSVEME